MTGRGGVRHRRGGAGPAAAADRCRRASDDRAANGHRAKAHTRHRATDDTGPGCGTTRDSGRAGARSGRAGGRGGARAGTRSDAGTRTSTSTGTCTCTGTCTSTSTSTCTCAGARGTARRTRTRASFNLGEHVGRSHQQTECNHQSFTHNALPQVRKLANGIRPTRNRRASRPAAQQNRSVTPGQPALRTWAVRPDRACRRLVQYPMTSHWGTRNRTIRQ